MLGAHWWCCGRVVCVRCVAVSDDFWLKHNLSTRHYYLWPLHTSRSNSTHFFGCSFSLLVLDNCLNWLNCRYQVSGCACTPWCSFNAIFGNCLETNGKKNSIRGLNEMVEQYNAVMVLMMRSTIWLNQNVANSEFDFQLTWGSSLVFAELNPLPTFLRSICFCQRSKMRKTPSNHLLDEMLRV